jgi:hypothetical protein
LFTDFFNSLVAISVAPLIAGMAKHFIFYVHWISILRILYFNLFSASFCIAFLSDGIATSVSKKLFIYYFRPTGQTEPLLFVCIPWCIFIFT